MAKEKTIVVQKRSVWPTIAIILISLFLMASFFAGIISLFLNPIQTGNVAIIPVFGTISSGSSSSSFSDVTSSSTLIKFIEEAENDPKIKAIVLEINSGGGTAVGSEEVVRAVKKTTKPTIAWVREVGASGAFWIATASDHTIASPISVVGSIGVISSYLDFSGFIDDHNVTYNRIVSGEFKDMGSPFKEITDKERALFANIVNDIKDYFVTDVALNRNLSKSYVNSIATGEVWLGQRALELKLIDQLGSKDEVTAHIENLINETVEYAVFAKSPGIFDNLIEAKSFIPEQQSGLRVNT